MEPIVSAVRKQESIRFPILDALRFILAFWVVMSHFGIFPLFAGVDENTRLGRLLVHGWRSIPFGTPAVIGFCYLRILHPPALSQR